ELGRQIDAADLQRVDLDPTPAGVTRTGAAHDTARRAHEQRLLVLESVEVEVERQGIDGALPEVRPGQGFGRRDLMARRIEARVDLVVGVARRAGRAAAPERGAPVGLWQPLDPWRSMVVPAGARERDEDVPPTHASLYIFFRRDVGTREVTRR